ELAQKEEAEIKIIEEYLPAPASDAEILVVVQEAIQETGAASIKDMGKVMKATMTRLVGKTVDGGRVSQLVKEKLGKYSRNPDHNSQPVHPTFCSTSSWSFTGLKFH